MTATNLPKFCRCGHTRFYHPWKCKFGKCECESFYSEQDNLKLMEFMKASKSLKYRFQALLDVFSVHQILLLPLILLITIPTAVSVVNHFNRISEAETVLRYSRTTAECYSGDKLIYSGNIKQSYVMSAGAHIILPNGEEYVCSGYHENPNKN